MSSRPMQALVVSVIVGTVFVAGCRTRPPLVQPAPPPPPAPAPVVQPPPPPPPPPPPAPAPAPVAPPTEAELFARMSLDQLNAQRPLEDVTFAYDSSDLSDRARASVQKNADYLKKWPSVRITVEGHADSRGTSEYNLSLGDRRANSVREYLVSLGVATTRVNTLSLGEEQPLCREEAESCWEQNRRGHFVITAK